MTIDQIIEVLKTRTKQVPSRNQLGNILSKNPEFVVFDTQRKRGMTVSYEVAVWTHLNWNPENETVLNNREEE